MRTEHEFTAEELKKLPQWAQTKIKCLQADNQNLQGIIDRLDGQKPDKQSRFVTQGCGWDGTPRIFLDSKDQREQALSYTAQADVEKTDDAP